MPVGPASPQDQSPPAAQPPGDNVPLAVLCPCLRRPLGQKEFPELASWRRFRAAVGAVGSRQAGGPPGQGSQKPSRPLLPLPPAGFLGWRPALPSGSGTERDAWDLASLTGTSQPLSRASPRTPTAVCPDPRAFQSSGLYVPQGGVGVAKVIAPHSPGVRVKTLVGVPPEPRAL